MRADAQVSRGQTVVKRFNAQPEILSSMARRKSGGGDTEYIIRVDRVLGAAHQKDGAAAYE
jgi:hypothetical protein